MQKSEMKKVILLLGEKQLLQLLPNILPNDFSACLLQTADCAEAQKIMSEVAVVNLLIDLDGASSESLACLERICPELQSSSVIGLTESNPLRKIVQALQAGVHQVINLRDEPHLLKDEIAKAWQQAAQQQQAEDLRKKRKARFDFSEIVGFDSSMQEVFDVLRRVMSRKWVTVLIRGETGTGKELIARAIHYNSFDQYRPFVSINCSALPETLLESELFGHEKGAFTDARQTKKGLFEAAENGTLFLDEIGDVQPGVQAKLLKALEEKRIRRVGGNQEIQVRTRIVAATNRDLHTAMQDGLFRTDLYYRLNVVSVFMPPLRERGDDVIVLAQHFLTQYAREYDSPMRGFSKEALALLKSHRWPGNVRELQHTIERIALLGQGQQVTKQDLLNTIEAESTLPMSQRDQSTSVNIVIPPEGMSLEDGEKKIISAVLEKTGWNKRQTAKILKISRPRLDRKIERYQLSQEQ